MAAECQEATKACHRGTCKGRNGEREREACVWSLKQMFFVTVSFQFAEPLSS